MTTLKESKQSVAPGAAVALSPSRLPLSREESFHQRTNLLYSKQRAADAAPVVKKVPQLMDNPLYEGGGGGFSSKGAGHSPIATSRNGNGVGSKSSGALVFDHQVKKTLRASMPRLSLDEEPKGSSSPTRNLKREPTRRMQSLSLSSREYEGMWAAVQENVLKTGNGRGSMNALEDFKQFREKLADLKQDAHNEGCEVDSVAPPPTPAVLTPSGSVRSSLNNRGSVSTRSLNKVASPSRPPTSPLSVIPSSKEVMGPNHHPHRELPPSSMHRLALSMRTDGLFKLPDPASILPLLTDNGVNSPPSQMLEDSVMNNNTASSTGTPSRRRFFSGGRSSAESKKNPGNGGNGNGNGKGKDADGGNVGDSIMDSWSSRTTSSRSQRSLGGGGQTTRSSIAADFSNDVESFLHSCSPRSLEALNTISPTATPRNSPQKQASKKKSEKIAVTSSSSPRAKEMKARCIHIPRTMCDSIHILE